MPAVPYYLGRPAGFWTAAMSGPTRATAANLAAVTSEVSPRAAAPAARRRTPEETGAPAATCVSNCVWEAWASNWFTPRRQP